MPSVDLHHSVKSAGTPRPRISSQKALLVFLSLRPNSITLSWSQTGPKLVTDLQRAGIWPII